MSPTENALAGRQELQDGCRRQRDHAAHRALGIMSNFFSVSLVFPSNAACLHLRQGDELQLTWSRPRRCRRIGEALEQGPAELDSLGHQRLVLLSEAPVFMHAR